VPMQTNDFMCRARLRRMQHVCQTQLRPQKAAQTKRGALLSGQQLLTWTNTGHYCDD
jgi:hypothetical protein